MESAKRDESSPHDVPLKRLEFVRLAAIRVVVVAVTLYDFATRSCGPLKSAISTTEGTIKTILGPVQDKLTPASMDLLVFLDDKVDEAAKKFDEHAPPVAKKLASKTWELIGKASEKGHILSQEAQTGGPQAAIRYSLTESKQVILSQSVNAFAKLKKVPSLHMVADVATLTAAHWTKKYNDAVVHTRERGYPLSSHLPLVPVDEIAKVIMGAVKPESD